MATPNPIIFGGSDIKNLFGKLALTNYYQVDFSGLAANTGSQNLLKHLKETTFRSESDKIIVNDFITRDVGLLCVDASLPSSSYATAEVKDNFMGITQEFAHTRLYTDADFTFYVDNNYFLLRFFEGWMDFVAGGNSRDLGEPAAGTVTDTNIYRRFNYPDDYKINSLTITKFERNYKIQDSNTLVYTFINAFPKTLTPVSVSYGPADLLKVTVSFNYDRYIVQRKSVSADLELLQEQFLRQLGQVSGEGTVEELNRINRQQGLA